MNSEYTMSEVVEIGKAQDVILGSKPLGGLDDIGFTVEDGFDE